MIVVTGTFRLPQSSIAIIRPVMEAKITDSRKDDGCIDYAYSFDALDNGLVHVIEKWRDRDALEAHFRTVHFSEWRAQVSALAVTDREMVAYETDDGFYI